MTPSDDHPDLTDLERAVMLAGLDREADVEDDAEHKRSHGIVHTPPLLARAMALRVDRALKAHLGRAAGLADSKVAVLDPACGPGAFLAACESVARNSKSRPAQYLGWDFDARATKAAKHVLSAPFEAASFPLVLDTVDTLAQKPSIAVDAHTGARTLVVIGNPPWASKSKSRGHIVSEGMMVDFRREPDGSPLREKKIGVLSDDYVRFLRWGAEAVRQAPGGGVLAFVTNSSWLDGPVHRGMRAALLRWFEGIDVYDLGGSALIAREPGRDDNVFGVRPGVCVVVAYRPRRHGELVEGARVRYARLRGTRAEKLVALGDKNLELEPLLPHASGFSFRRTGTRILVADSVPLDQAMPFHREGVQTNRDAVVVADSLAELLARLRTIASGDMDPDVASALVASAHFKPDVARARVAAALAEDPDGTKGIVARRIAYRPFVTRYFSPIAPLCHRPRPDLLAAMAGSSFALITVSKDRSERAWAHAAGTDAVPDNCFLSNRSSCRARAFPTHDPSGEENLAPKVRRDFEERTGRSVDSERFALYALGVLASQTYRTRHDAVLREALPNIPYPKDGPGFEHLCAAGRALLRAFDAPPETADVVIGHYAIDYAPLALALAEEACERAFRAMFEDGV